MGKDLAAATNFRAQLETLFAKALAAAFPALEGEEPLMAACNQPKNGDYQCNNAMSLFGKLKGKPGAPKAPRDVATALLAALPANDMISETSLAGPGFINLRLARPFVAANVSAIITQGTRRLAPDLSSLRVVVDFSSPNVAKEMHVGHLRSTIIGDTIARTLELCGAHVLRLNHIGDWGTQFGMLIEHMRELRPEGLGDAGGREEDVADLMRLYKASKKRFDEDEAFKTRARESVTALQSGEPSARAAWQRICAASRKEFQAIYTRLGVTLQVRATQGHSSRCARGSVHTAVVLVPLMSVGPGWRAWRADSARPNCLEGWRVRADPASYQLPACWPETAWWRIDREGKRQSALL
ncbi:tRNA synthetases class I (R)-domain-containing protein [Haematococcus lacustris]